MKSFFNPKDSNAYPVVGFGICFFCLTLLCCSTDQASLEEGMGEGNDSQENTETECPDNRAYFYEEANGIVSIEFEDNEFPDGWVLRNDVPDVSGDGFMQWEGNASMGNPGNGIVVFPIRIHTPGTYRFLWKSSYQQGTNGTEHNDSWLRFPDATDFFGKKDNGSVVYPKGTGKTPNPNGASADGWFKIYRSGNDSAFKWQASTSDHDAHEVYVTFSKAGLYLMEISARSTFHGIDRLLLFNENISRDEAIQAADSFSDRISCE